MAVQNSYLYVPARPCRGWRLVAFLPAPRDDCHGLTSLNLADSSLALALFSSYPDSVISGTLFEADRLEIERARRKSLYWVVGGSKAAHYQRVYDRDADA